MEETPNLSTKWAEILFLSN